MENKQYNSRYIKMAIHNKYIIIVVIALLLGACTKEVAIEDGMETTLSVNLAINSLATDDPMAINQDQTFGSLAIYVYKNDASSTLEQAALLPAFLPVGTKQIVIQTDAGDKLVYMIANYVGKTFRLTSGGILILGTSTSRQELDNIVVESSSGFSPNSLVMVGKQSMSLSTSDKDISINLIMRRLQARVDVHVYKGPNFGSNIVTLESVTLYNQVRNSEVKFDYNANAAQMLTSPMFNTQVITSSAVLPPYINGVTLLPANAQAIFYSYQNLVTVSSPIQTTAPYLEVKINANGIPHTYKGYFTDNNQVNNKYSLRQNNVYQIVAQLDVDSKMILNMNVLPWNQQNIEYERPITSNDFSFGAWGTSWGGLNGKTINTNIGGIEDAVFQFELKAPMGAAWVATLTNGLDFSFVSSTAGTTTPTISSGFTSAGSPCLIAVRATKRWTGDLRDSEFYITVQGREIPINPIVGTQRLYEGTDTRIKIKQVASYN